MERGTDRTCWIHMPRLQEHLGHTFRAGSAQRGPDPPRHALRGAIKQRGAQECAQRTPSDGPGASEPSFSARCAPDPQGSLILPITTLCTRLYTDYDRISLLRLAAENRGMPKNWGRDSQRREKYPTLTNPWVLCERTTFTTRAGL